MSTSSGRLSSIMEKDRRVFCKTYAGEIVMLSSVLVGKISK